jgi:hypothetical protein
MTADPWALLREAYDILQDEGRSGGAWDCMDLANRIDAALAGRAEGSTEDVVESDTAVAPPETEWWSLSQQEADIGRVHLRVWRANAREWHWTVWKRLPSSEGNSGKCATEAEAKSAAIAAARGMR